MAALGFRLPRRFNCSVSCATCASSSLNRERRRSKYPNCQSRSWSAPHFSNWFVYLEGANQRVVNSRFYNSGVLGLPSSSNIYVGYSVIDGANSAGFSGLIESRGSGSVTVEYNWLKNSGGDIVQMHNGGKAALLVLRYNLIENAGMAAGAHGDWTEFIDGPFVITIMYNTTSQSGGASQGFMAEPDIGSSPGRITQGEVGNNTLTGAVNAFTAVTVADIVNTYQVHDNFFDASKSSSGLTSAERAAEPEMRARKLLGPTT